MPQGATLMFIDRHGDRTVIERGAQPAAPLAAAHQGHRASGLQIARPSLPPRPLSPAPTEGHITALPEEILIKVVDELAQGSLPVLGRISRVCRRFYAAVASARRVSLSIAGELPIEQLYIPYHAVRTGDVLYVVDCSDTPLRAFRGCDLSAPLWAAGSTFMGGAQGSGPSAAHVAVHGDRVYLAAYKGNRILVYDAADGTPVGVRDQRLHTALLPTVNSPIALAINSDRTLLWVACDDDYVRGYQLKPDGTLDKIVAQVGGYGEGAGRFRHPRGVALMSDDELAVTDMFNHLVQIFSVTKREIPQPHGRPPLTMALDFTRQWGGRGAAPGQFDHPWGCAAMGGVVYVCEHHGHRVQGFSRLGELVCLLRWPNGSGDLRGLSLCGRSVLVADCGLPMCNRAVVVHELKREVSIEQAEREAEEGVARALGGLQIR